MTTNPNNAIGTNGAYGGRTSVNALNDNLAAYTARGIISGWEASPNSGMTIQLGGITGTRDVAVAEDASGNKTTINNISGSPIEITLSAAPSTNSRIDSIVAYVENPPQGTNSGLDNPGACGIIAVSGTVAASPSAPTESTIRSAITSDGGTGSTAYFVVLANITVVNGTTDITSDAIEPGAKAGIGANNIDFTTFNASTPVQVGTWVDGSPIYRKTFTGNLSGSTNRVAFPLGVIGATVLGYDGAVTSENDTVRFFPNIVLNNGAIDEHFFLSQLALSATGECSFTYGDWFKNSNYTYRISFYYVDQS